MKVAVLGASGNQGFAVAKHVQKSGHEVFAIVRDLESPKIQKLKDLGVHLVYGDMDKPETLDSAFAGMDGVFSIQNFWQTGHLSEFFQGRAVVEAAKKAKIRYFIQTTGGINPGMGSANMEVKSIIEALVREAFPDAFIIRPVWFIEGFNPTSFNAKNKTLEFVTPPTMKHAWVSVDDIGKISAKAFDYFSQFAGLTINFASQQNTALEIVDAINKTFGSKLGYHQFTDIELEDKIKLWSGGRGEFYHELKGIFTNIKTVNFEVDMAVHDKLLPNRQTLETWIREFAYPLWKDEVAIFGR